MARAKALVRIERGRVLPSTPPVYQRPSSKNLLRTASPQAPRASLRLPAAALKRSLQLNPHPHPACHVQDAILGTRLGALLTLHGRPPLSSWTSRDWPLQTEHADSHHLRARSASRARAGLTPPAWRPDSGSAFCVHSGPYRTSRGSGGCDDTGIKNDSRQLHGTPLDSRIAHSSRSVRTRSQPAYLGCLHDSGSTPGLCASRLAALEVRLNSSPSQASCPISQVKTHHRGVHNARVTRTSCVHIGRPPSARLGRQRASLRVVHGARGRERIPHGNTESRCAAARCMHLRRRLPSAALPAHHARLPTRLLPVHAATFPALLARLSGSDGVRAPPASFPHNALHADGAPLGGPCAVSSRYTTLEGGPRVHVVPG
ncbi:hypothetical protein B0H14DRAFT_3670528 [Mycena olivaceomarginata]|nr:hypothetical protein B0H14DRAFT_3670528 [Mycena olivaceomarginata]